MQPGFDDLLDELKDLNRVLKKSIEASDKYTRALIAFAMVQILFAYGSFVFASGAFQNHPILSGIFVALLIGMSAYAIKLTFDQLEKKK